VNANNTLFSIFISQILEVTPKGQQVKAVDVTKVNFTYTQTQTHSYQFWNYSAVLLESAKLEVYLYFFTNLTNSTTLDLNNQTSPNYPNTIKLALLLANWPFSSAQNYIQVVFEDSVLNFGASECDVDFSSQTDSGGSLISYSLNVAGTTLYATMERFAIVDGIQRRVNFSNPSPTLIVAQLPFFWQNATLDPNFGALVSTPPSRSCASSSSNYLYVIPIVLILAAFVAAAAFFPKYKKWRKSKEKMEVQVDMDEMQLEADEVET